MLLARSAPEGEADEIGAKADIAARTSAVGGKADVPARWPGSPLLVISGSGGQSGPRCLASSPLGPANPEARTRESPAYPEPQCVNETAPAESPLNAHCRPNIERIIRWTLRDDGEDELGQGRREVEQDIVEVIAESEGEL